MMTTTAGTTLQPTCATAWPWCRTSLCDAYASGAGEQGVQLSTWVGSSLAVVPYLSV
jgi:hypothetical protein